MTLPSAQQRALDGIADGLRRSEPKLAAKYAMFSRLCAGDAPPHRERLASTDGRLATFWWWARTTQGRRMFRQLLIAGQVAIAFVMITVLVSIGFHGSSAHCGVVSRGGAVSQPRPSCPLPALPLGLAGK